MTKILRYLAVAVAVLAITSCKLAVIVVEGGEVQSTASGTCPAGTVCIHEVADTTYAETFTAVPAPGWRFVRWSSGDDFHCQEGSSDRCILGVVFGEEPGVQALVAADKTYYIMPIFDRGGSPIPESDIVTIEDKEWAQMDLFTNLEWEDIEPVCPLPSGECSGHLAGYNMAGWTWASVDDMNALFNFYIGSDQLGPGPSGFIIRDLEAAIGIFSLGFPGFRNINSLGPWVGWMRSTPKMAWFYLGLSPNNFILSFSTNTSRYYWADSPNSGFGAWFYRTP